MKMLLFCNFYWINKTTQTQKVWGTSQQSAYYDTKLRGVKVKIAALKSSISDTRSLRFILEEPRQRRDTLDSLGDVESLKLTKMGSGIHTANSDHGTEVKETTRVNLLTRKYHNFEMSKKDISKTIEKAAQITLLNPQGIQPGERLLVKWSLCNHLTRREQAYLAVFRLGSKDPRVDYISLYKGWLIKSGKGFLCDNRFTAPTIPGKYMLGYFEDLLTVEVPERSKILFTVTDSSKKIAISRREHLRQIILFESKPCIKEVEVQSQPTVSKKAVFGSIRKPLPIPQLTNKIDAQYSPRAKLPRNDVFSHFGISDDSSIKIVDLRNGSKRLCGVDEKNKKNKKKISFLSFFENP